MGRYKEETHDSSLSDALLTIFTGIPVSILTGPSYKSVITDQATGKQGVGYGSSKQKAHDKAWANLQKK